MDAVSAPAPEVSEAPKKRLFSRFPEKTYLYSRVNKFLYAPVPKAACSTIKAQLYQFYRAQPRHSTPLPVFLPRDFSGKWFHLYMHGKFSLSTASPKEAEAFLEDKAVYRFTFVRNPLSRLASAFLNKFVEHRFDEEQWEHALPTLRRIHGEDAMPLTHSLTFAQFVSDVCQAENKQLDKHWQPQHHFINPELGFHVGRVENMARDFRAIAARAKLPPELMQANRTKSETLPDDAYWDMDADQLRSLPALPKTAQLYNPELEAAVRDRYSDDFRIFKY